MNMNEDFIKDVDAAYELARKLGKACAGNDYFVVIYALALMVSYIRAKRPLSRN